MIPETKKELAGLIDHTLLGATALRADIEAHCAEAVKYGFHSGQKLFGSSGPGQTHIGPFALDIVGSVFKNSNQGHETWVM